MAFIVAVDGPAGSGKGTLAKKLADKLNFINIDTGAMYRCIALYTIKNGIEVKDTQKIIEALENIKIELRREDEKQVVILNNEVVTDEIRTNEVNNIVSDVSGIEKVREKMVNFQRNLAKGKDIVMEGRDIGTTVFPNADIKIYLDASLEARVHRRHAEYLEKGIDVSYEEVRESIIKRDEKDRNRKFGALKKAEDAILLDSTNLTIEEVLDKAVLLIEERRGK